VDFLTPKTLCVYDLGRCAHSESFWHGCHCPGVCAFYVLDSRVNASKLKDALDKRRNDKE
jgi:hypothetical protein